MAELHFSKKAVEDLTEIWNYTCETWSEQQADRYYNTLIASCRKIKKNPLLFGKQYDAVLENLYGYKVNRHIIFYIIGSDEHIEVVRILHVRMDINLPCFAIK